MPFHKTSFEQEFNLQAYNLMLIVPKNNSLGGHPTINKINEVSSQSERQRLQHNTSKAIRQRISNSKKEDPSPIKEERWGLIKLTMTQTFF